MPSLLWLLCGQLSEGCQSGASAIQVQLSTLIFANLKKTFNFIQT